MPKNLVATPPTMGCGGGPPGCSLFPLLSVMLTSLIVRHKLWMQILCPQNRQGQFLVCAVICNIRNSFYDNQGLGEEMSFTNLQRQWQHAAKQLGLQVETPFRVSFDDGSHVEVEVLLRGFGARNGMLVLSDYRTIEKKKDEII